MLWIAFYYPCWISRFLFWLFISNDKPVWWTVKTLVWAGRRGLTGGPLHYASPQDVDVDVVDGLASVRPVVDYDPVAARQSRILSALLCNYHHVAQQLRDRGRINEWQLCVYKHVPGLQCLVVSLVTDKSAKVGSNNCTRAGTNNHPYLGIAILRFGQLNNWLFWDNEDVSGSLGRNIREGHTLKYK